MVHYIPHIFIRQLNESVSYYLKTGDSAIQTVLFAHFLSYFFKYCQQSTAETNSIINDLSTTSHVQRHISSFLFTISFLSSTHALWLSISVLCFFPPPTTTIYLLGCFLNDTLHLEMKQMYKLDFENGKLAGLSCWRMGVFDL